jgi:4-amino-4-deoxy-L-arabinose transferase-like glycosyltransferase
VLGVIVTIVFSLGFAGLASILVKRLVSTSDLALVWGLSGMVGLGIAGWITLPIGLIPGGLNWGIGIVGLLSLAGLIVTCRSFKEWRIAKPDGTGLLWGAVLCIGCLFALVGVLAPSTKMDWDSISYHLAVPKLWLENGQIGYVSFIHHSNFPSCVDNLYIWGLKWGGQSGAKAFSLVFLIFGLMAIFGLARTVYGQTAARWATLGFLVAPVVMWESGTAYIDVSHGLFIGLGVALCARSLQEDSRKLAYIGSILIGFGIGSKYTGLQSIAAWIAVLAFLMIVVKPKPVSLKAIVSVGVIALVIGCPWYIKNYAMVGNPVFPFFYEKLGGRNWDQRRADIYKNEQLTFGVGREAGNLNLTTVGHAILGLGYQPGRYVNPMPQQGMGFPQSASGVVALLGALAWLFSGRSKRFEGSLLAWSGISLAMWFVLSQQSRYLVAIMPPLCMLAGGAIVRLKLGRLVAGGIALQAVFSILLIYSEVVSGKMPVILGNETPEAYVSQNLPIAAVAPELNQIAKGGKVALYDEVIGFYLDIPYYWANPGHSTEIPYDRLNDGHAYVQELRKQGFTHVYMNLGMMPQEPEDPKQQTPLDLQRWLRAAGLKSPTQPYSEAERKAITSDWQIKWKFLIADAVRSGELRLVPFQSQWPRSIVLFELNHQN